MAVISAQTQRGADAVEARQAQVVRSNALPTVEPPGRFAARFALFYAGFGVVFAAALIGLILLVIRPGYRPGPPWSRWKPSVSSDSEIGSQIASHVGHEYRIGGAGGELLAVFSGPPVVTSGTQDISIKVVAVRHAPRSDTGIAEYDASKMEQFDLCGLGARCSFSTAQPTTTRAQLVRREALELALYTFKFSPSVDSIAAFMPPTLGQSAGPMLYMRRSDVTQELRQPLSKTLPLRTPPLPTRPDLFERKTINTLTLPHLYTYQFVGLQSGGAALILDPAS